MTSETERAAFAEMRQIMVDRHVRPADVTRHDLLDAMLKTSRELHVPKAKRATAYMGEHLELQPGRFELDPRVFAKMVEATAPETTDLALVVGSLGGYAAAVLAPLVAAVFALENDETLAALATTAFEAEEQDNVIPVAQALEAGYPKSVPYNVILVNGAIARRPAQAWLDQLAEGGRLVVLEIKGAVGQAMLYVKTNGIIGHRPIFDATAPVLPGFEPEMQFEF